MVAVFEELAAMDNRLLAIPYGSEFDAVPLLALRGELVATLGSAPLPEEYAAALLELKTSTVALHHRFSHFRRRLAAEIGESGSHRQFLETLADSLEPVSSADQILA